MKRFNSSHYLRQFLLALSVLLIAFTHSAGALSQNQKDIYSKGIYYFDADVSSSCASSIPPGNLPSFIPEPYNGAFTAAGKAYKVSPVLIASIFTEEHFTNQPTSSLVGDWKGLPNIQKDPNSGWATSPDQAMGPFQFIPSTWASLGVDADHNGVKDVENLLDASFGAANYMATDGATADKPKSVWVNFADGYSGHTGGYANKVSEYIDFYASGGTNTTATGAGAGASCSALGGSIVDTALKYAWNDVGQPGGHGFTSKDSFDCAGTKSTDVNVCYEAAMKSSGFSDTTDCSYYIATVMRISGADKSFPGGSGAQLQYATDHPDKYQVLPYSPNLQPGDILATSDHVYLYVGKQADGFSVAQASVGDHVPEVNSMPYQNQNDGAGDFSIIRIKQ